MRLERGIAVHKPPSSQSFGEEEQRLMRLLLNTNITRQPVRHRLKPRSNSAAIWSSNCPERSPVRCHGSLFNRMLTERRTFTIDGSRSIVRQKVGRENIFYILVEGFRR